MGSMFSPPSVNVPTPPAPPPAAIPPTLASTAARAAGQSERARAAAAGGSGFDNTLKTSSQGALGKPATAEASLLGQV